MGWPCLGALGVGRVELLAYPDGRLNAEFGRAFVGREEREADLTLRVDRARQLEAIARHRSRSADNPVPQRRLELQGDREWLVFLPGRSPHGPHGPFAGPSTPAGSMRKDERRRR